MEHVRDESHEHVRHVTSTCAMSRARAPCPIGHSQPRALRKPECCLRMTHPLLDLSMRPGSNGRVELDLSSRNLSEDAVDLTLLTHTKAQARTHKRSIHAPPDAHSSSNRTHRPENARQQSWGKSWNAR